MYRYLCQVDLNMADPSKRVSSVCSHHKSTHKCLCLAVYLGYFMATPVKSNGDGSEKA